MNDDLKRVPDTTCTEQVKGEPVIFYSAARNEIYSAQDTKPQPVADKV